VASENRTLRKMHQRLAEVGNDWWGSFANAGAGSRIPLQALPSSTFKLTPYHRNLVCLSMIDVECVLVSLVDAHFSHCRRWLP
jgi:hypothetical protein